VPTLASPSSGRASAETSGSVDPAAGADARPGPAPDRGGPDKVDVTIVIVTYNAGEHVRSGLTALLADGGPRARHEVIVVDNASSPSLVPLLREHAGGATIIRLEENIGFGRACNLAAERARGRYVLLLNPDAVVRPDTVDRMVAAAHSDPGTGVLGGRNVLPDGTTDPRSCWGAPSVWSAFCFATGLSTAFAGSLVFDPESLGRWQRDTARDVPVVTGSLLLAPTAVWRELGGFDPDYFMYGEDADLSRRARRAGRRVWITPDALIEHSAGASSTSAAKAVLLWQGRMTYTRKTFPPATRWLVRVLLLAGVGLRATVFRALGRDAGYVHAWRRRADWRDGYPPVTTGPGAHAGGIA
jgi:hypothetical protein